MPSPAAPVPPLAALPKKSWSLLEIIWLEGLVEIDDLLMTTRLGVKRRQFLDLLRALAQPEIRAISYTTLPRGRRRAGSDPQTKRSIQLLDSEALRIVKASAQERLKPL